MTDLVQYDSDYCHGTILFRVFVVVFWRIFVVYFVISPLALVRIGIKNQSIYVIVDIFMNVIRNINVSISCVALKFFCDRINSVVISFVFVGAIP